MIADNPNLTVPIQMDAHGVMRVSGTRVTLSVILARYNQGETPELIHEGFSTVPLADIYTVIAHYLANRAEVDAYLDEQEKEADRIRAEIKANYTPEQWASIDRFQKLRDEAQEMASGE